MSDVIKRCEHCNGKLKEDLEMKKKGRDDVFVCQKCGCVFCICHKISKELVLVRGTPKCIKLREKRAKTQEETGTEKPKMGNSNRKYKRKT